MGAHRVFFSDKNIYSFEGAGMGFHKIILKTVVLLFSTVVFSSQLQADSGSTYSVFENIVLTQNITTSGHRLCQDGLFIYFKNVYECKRSKAKVNCAGSLRITPVQSTEKIYIDVAGESVTRFYQVQTKFRHKVFSIAEGKADFLLSNRSRKIPYCKWRQRHEPQIVGTWRYPESAKEKVLLQAIIDSGFSLLNTPIGKVNIAANLGLNDYYSAKKKKPILKTPYCNDEISDDQIHLMSGEYSGSGITKVSALQSLSRRIYLSETNYVIDKTTNKKSYNYNLSCYRTWDI